MEAYEIYKNAVCGITFLGDKMREFDELPDKIKNAWETVDKHYRNLSIINNSMKTKENIKLDPIILVEGFDNMTIQLNKSCSF